jgi:hypothetical protein
MADQTISGDFGLTGLVSMTNDGGAFFKAWQSALAPDYGPGIRGWGLLLALWQFSKMQEERF